MASAALVVFLALADGLASVDIAVSVVCLVSVALAVPADIAAGQVIPQIFFNIEQIPPVHQVTQAMVICFGITLHKQTQHQ